MSKSTAEKLVMTMRLGQQAGRLLEQFEHIMPDVMGTSDQEHEAERAPWSAVVDSLNDTQNNLWCLAERLTDQIDAEEISAR